VHTGLRARARVEPAPFGAGLAFVVGGVRIPATIACARAVPGATLLERRGVRVLTPEHLLAALAGVGVTDATVHVHGEELPILDGSARSWCEGLTQVGLLTGPPCEERV